MDHLTQARQAEVSVKHCPVWTEEGCRAQPWSLAQEQNSLNQHKSHEIIVFWRLAHAQTWSMEKRGKLRRRGSVISAIPF